MEKTVVTKLPAGDIVEIRRLPDGTLEVVQRLLVETGDKEENVVLKTFNDWQKDNFVLIKASKLSLDDDFMKYEPKEEQDQTFYKSLSEVIKKGVKDFYRPPMDPSFTDDYKESIEFVMGKPPATAPMSYNSSYIYWKRIARRFMPERNSRLGTRSEYIAFLGVLIKELVSQGWSNAQAWNFVCKGSRELGNYYDAKNPESRIIELTGSREFVGFYDLANTCKLLTDDTGLGGFWMASGYRGKIADSYLACLYHFSYSSVSTLESVGWIVLEK